MSTMFIIMYRGRYVAEDQTGKRYTNRICKAKMFETQDEAEAARKWGEKIKMTTNTVPLKYYP